MSSGSVDIKFLEVLESAALALFAVISQARDGFIINFFATFFDTLSPFLP